MSFCFNIVDIGNISELRKVRKQTHMLCGKKIKLMIVFCIYCITHSTTKRFNIDSSTHIHTYAQTKLD